MGPRRRVLLLIFIMAIIVIGVEAIAISILYTTAFNQQKDNLFYTATSQARLIEAIAKFDKIHSKDYPGGASEGTLSQIIDAHMRYTGFGQTGEFTLAKKQGNEIVYILSHRHYDYNLPKPVSFDSNLAVPMRLALLGKSGTVVGLDYRGEKVLAAYEPVRELNWGITAKIDLAEVRAPFIRAAAISGILGIVAIILGATIFIKLTNPLLTKLNETIAELQAAMSNVNQLSGLLPICASCKKIRDDQGYWTQIEAYIRDHSEAEFSHSICPDCIKKLYPDLGNKKS
jgi:hypothetical protein